MCVTSWKDYLLPSLTKTFPAQLWLNKLLLFFVIYFYSKEFVSLSQKLGNHTTNSSKVHRVTLMVESSLGSPNVPKVMKEKRKGKEKILKTNPKPMMTLGRDITWQFVFSHCQLQIYFSRIKYSLTWVNPSYQLQHLNCTLTVSSNQHIGLLKQK